MAAGSGGGTNRTKDLRDVGDVGELVRIAAELRRAIAATPSQQARLRHQEIIHRAAWSLRGRRNRILRAL